MDLEGRLGFRGKDVFKPKTPPLLFHHADEVGYCVPGEIIPPDLEVKAGNIFAADYANLVNWLSGEIGFQPVFMSVGRFDDRRTVGITQYYNYKPVLFSYSDTLGGVFTDYKVWENILFGLVESPSDARDQLFRPNLTREDWIKKSLAEPGSVQLLVPSLDLSKADKICARTHSQVDELAELGFEVRKIALRT
jgi:hypothetical protein